MLKYIFGALIACSAIAQADDLLTGSAIEMNAVTATADLSVRQDIYYRYSRPDMRKCASPMCGGFYVKAVNSAKVRCADGKMRPECYVSNLDAQLLNWSDDDVSLFQDRFSQQQALVRGSISYTPYHESAISTLQISEAWDSATGKTNPPGAATKYYFAHDNGIRCITTPCYSVDVTPLNNAKSKNTVSEIDLSASGATDAQQQQAYEELNGDGLIIAGHEQAAKNSGKGQGKDKGRLLVAETFYWTANHSTDNNPPLMCGGIQGLSCQKGQVCDITIPNACNGADLSGVCITPPDVCTKNYDPVCGCDGKTYSNDCARQAAGVQLNYVGRCDKSKN